MQKNRLSALIPIAALCFLSIGCSGTMAVAQTAPKPEVAESAKTAEESEPIVNSTLNAETFYKILLGELNLLDEEPRIAFALILDSARKTKDDVLFERAVTIALQSRSGESALSAARAWLVATPTSLAAARYMVQISLGMNRLDQPAGKADNPWQNSWSNNILTTGRANQNPKFA
jgi:hypothetical protein